MQSIKKILKSLLSRIINVFSGLYENGIGDLISNKRWFKGVIDVVLLCIYIYFVVYYGYMIPVALVSMGIMMTIINRLTATEDGFIMIDITKPFLTIALFSFVSVIYSFVREAAIISSVLIVPVMTKQIHDRIDQYYNQLTPVSGD